MNKANTFYTHLIFTKIWCINIGYETFIPCKIINLKKLEMVWRKINHAFELSDPNILLTVLYHT